VPEWIPFFGGCEATGGGAPGYQIAYGITLECENDHGFPLDEMLLMDFSTDHLVDDTELAGGEEGHVPTFLYAFPMDRKTVFLQETHLVARNHRARCKSLEMEEMVRRLDRRISTLGLKVKRRFDEECSVIPMGGPLPVLGQPTVAYGAAAIMAHPASGYMINRVILQAPEVAAAMATSLRGNGSPAEAAEAAWEAIWYVNISISLSPFRSRASLSLSLVLCLSHTHAHARTHTCTHTHTHAHTHNSLSLTHRPKHRLIERDLYCFGMEVLLDLDLALLRDFFRAFFVNPKAKMWREFLAWHKF
jgi:hypothetical protein